MLESPIAYSISFSVEGKARPKARPQSSSRHGFLRHYTPRATTNYEDAIRKAAVSALNGRSPFDGPVSMSVIVRRRPPSRVPKATREQMLAGHLRPTIRPDLDNILKAVADAMNKAIIRDDADIVDLVGAKRYAVDDGIDVIIERAASG